MKFSFRVIGSDNIDNCDIEFVLKPFVMQIC